MEIPPFAFVTTSDGKYYSYSPYQFEGCHLPRNLDKGTPFDLVMHNGMWKKYNVTLTPNGSDFETFNLQGLSSDIDNQGYATTSHLFAVEVVKVMRDDNQDVVDWSKTEINVFRPTSCGLFKGLPNQNDTDSAHNFLYNGIGQDTYVFNVELNERKQLVIKFGDGITTRKLTSGSELHLFYLETQGMNGGIQASSDELTIQFPSSESLDIVPELFHRLFGGNPLDGEDVKCHALTSSTSAIREEGPD